MGNEITFKLQKDPVKANILINGKVYGVVNDVHKPYGFTLDFFENTPDAATLRLIGRELQRVIVELNNKSITTIERNKIKCKKLKKKN